MTELEKRLIHLDHCRGVGWHLIKSILAEDQYLERLYQRTTQYWQEKISHLSKNLDLFLQDLNNQQLKSISSSYFPNHLSSQTRDKPVKALTFFNDFYPKRLKEIPQPPWVLYCLGNLNLLHHYNTLAIIGTRDPTKYGINSLFRFVPKLVENKITIISGLARGIDSKSQEIALRLAGNVIAVIGGGIDHLYPKENQFLAEQLYEKGLVISEYPPDTVPRKWHFPLRNRIISGLSRSILVIEGRKDSGTFITVQQGLEQGKDIYALPGSIFSPQSEGPHSLIKEGAGIVQDAEDILVEWL